MMVHDMTMEGVDGTAWATRGAKWKNAPLIDVRMPLFFQISPKEVQQRLIFWKEDFGTLGETLNECLH